MKAAVPIGEREDESLEFKARDALGDLPSIGREVVGMLNRSASSHSSAAQLWIGIAEHDGVSYAVESVPPGEWDRLWNHLVDTLEPSPVEQEVSHEMVPLRGGGAVLCIKVNASRRGPVAQLKQGGRFYWKRVGPRIRIMTHDEIFATRPRGAQQSTMQERLSSEAERRMKNGRPGLWLRIEADDVTLQTSSREFARFLQDPELTKNRESGWNAINPYRPPEIRQSKISQGTEDGGPRIDVHRTGAIVLDVPLESLHWKGPDHDIWPYAFIEYVVSTLRIAATLYAKATARPAESAAHLALLGLRGWSLSPGSPLRGGFAHDHRRVTYDRDDLILDQPVVFHRGELQAQPELSATRLLIPVYESFGFRETDMPPEFDRRTGRLTLPG